MAAQWAPSATVDFPEPVGVATTTFAPVTTSTSASSCAGYSVMPWSVTQPAKASKTASGSSWPSVPVRGRRSARGTTGSSNGTTSAPAAGAGRALAGGASAVIARSSLPRRGPPAHLGQTVARPLCLVGLTSSQVYLTLLLVGRAPARGRSNRVRPARTGLGLTQAELAAAVGVTRQTVVAIEGGDYAPSVYLALAVAARLGETVEGLFGDPEAEGTAVTPAGAGARR